MRLLAHILQVFTFIEERRTAFVMMTNRNGVSLC